MPDMDKNCPISVKRGIVISVVSVIWAKAVVATVYKPLVPISRKIKPALIPPRAKETGTPRNIKMIIALNKMRVINARLICNDLIQVS